MKNFGCFFILLLFISGCRSGNPVAVIADPAIRVLEVAQTVVSDPLNKSAIKRGIYKQQIESSERELRANSFYNSGAKLCKAPRYPAIPSKPDWTCTNQNIQVHKARCLLNGVGEFACGEFIESKIEKTGKAIYSGVSASAGCTGVSNLMANGTISVDEVIASGLLGGFDNYGEQLMKDGGVFGTMIGGVVRASAGAGKGVLVRSCQRRVELSCNPAPIRARISSMQQEYMQCQRKLNNLQRYL